MGERSGASVASPDDERGVENRLMKTDRGGAQSIGLFVAGRSVAMLLFAAAGSASA
jgi:hypothetical protein